MKIQTFNTFKKTHKRYHKSPVLYLDHYGYNNVMGIEYDEGEQPKPRVEVEKYAKVAGYKDIVYHMTTHSCHQPWIEIYAKVVEK